MTTSSMVYLRFYTFHHWPLPLLEAIYRTDSSSRTVWYTSLTVNNRSPGLGENGCVPRVMPPALPGFHYDAEKKKYFKIQSNHVAAHGSACKYSKAALEKEAEEQREQKRRRLFEQKKKKMRMQRSKVLESPLGGGWGVMRELGVTKVDSAIVARAWVHGLQRKKVSGFQYFDGDNGTFVFDSATGVLTYADAICENGSRIFCRVFVYLLVVHLRI